MSARLDHTIFDPLDRETKPALVAAKLVLGHDHHYLNYARLFKGPDAKATQK